MKEGVILTQKSGAFLGCLGGSGEGKQECWGSVDCLQLGVGMCDGILVKNKLGQDKEREKKEEVEDQRDVIIIPRMCRGMEKAYMGTGETLVAFRWVQACVRIIKYKKNQG